MNDGEILSKLGELLARYYLDLYQDTTQMSLFIDELTMNDIFRSSGFPLRLCRNALHASPSIHISQNSYKSIAIAAFQIMVSNDVHSNGFYDKLRSEIPYFSGVDNQTLMKQYFEFGQDQVWKSVYDYFKANGKEIYEFPIQKQSGPGRYVRYPLSQQLVSPKVIISYADLFQKNLEPHMPYTFAEFKERVAFAWNHNSDLIKHLVFSFYQTWDGQSCRDLREHHTKARVFEGLGIHKTDTIVKLCEADHSFDVSHYDSSSDEFRPVDVKTLLNKNEPFRLFGYECDFQDWILLKRSCIPYDIASIGILCTMHYYKFIEQSLDAKPEGYFKEGIVFAVFNSEKVVGRLLQRLNIVRQGDLSVWLSGGIKIARDTYVDEALPILNFKYAQTVIYVNSKRVTLASVTNVSLQSLLNGNKPGEYFIKIPSSAPMHVVVTSFQQGYDHSMKDRLGFQLRDNSIGIFDIHTGETAAIRGIESFVKPIKKQVTCRAERGFVMHKNSFERQFRKRGVNYEK